MHNSKERFFQEKKIIHKGKTISLRIDVIPHQDGSMHHYVEHPGAIVMVPIDEKGEICDAKTTDMKNGF